MPNSQKSKDDSDWNSRYKALRKAKKPSPKPALDVRQKNSLPKSHILSVAPKRFEINTINTPAVLRVFIVPDAHVPRHDKRAWPTALALLREFRPHYVVIIGDFADLEALSHHPKNRPDITRLSWEYHEVNLALDDLQNAAPSAKFYYLEGNHEYRSVKFTQALGNLDGALDVAQNLHILPVLDSRRHDDLRGITWLPFENYLHCAWVAPWAVGYLHSAKANKGGFGGGGVNHAAYHANTIGPISRCDNIVYGHNHTFQMFRSSSGYEAWCCGFLGDLRDRAFMYAAGPNNWVNGVMVQEISGSLVTTTPIHIRNGTAGPTGLLRNGPSF